jgi:hypothetical protein
MSAVMPLPIRTVARPPLTLKVQTLAKMARAAAAGVDAAGVDGVAAAMSGTA